MHFRSVTFVAGGPPLFVHVEVVEESEPTSDPGFPVRDVDGPGQRPNRVGLEVLLTTDSEDVFWPKGCRRRLKTDPVSTGEF